MFIPVDQRPWLTLPLSSIRNPTFDNDMHKSDSKDSLDDDSTFLEMNLELPVCSTSPNESLEHTCTTIGS